MAMISMSCLADMSNGQKMAVYYRSIGDCWMTPIINVPGYWWNKRREEIPIPCTVKSEEEMYCIASTFDNVPSDYFIGGRKRIVQQAAPSILGGDFNEPSYREWTKTARACMTICDFAAIPGAVLSC